VEHVEHPHKAVEEIHRLLKPGGILVMSSVMDFPIHNYPHDYWRFTPEGFKSLLKPFGGGIVGYQGDPLQPHTVFAVGLKGGAFMRETFDKFLVIARASMKTGNAPSESRVRWLRRLTAMPFVARRERFCQMVERHVDPDRLHFEIFKDGASA
jgi:SAM-dependent methyltransferase